MKNQKASVLDPITSLALEYGTDRLQRTLLFWDILRQRGNNYLAHLAENQPPILVFDHQLVMDGMSLDRPVNYRLVRIVDRRQKGQSRAVAPKQDRRRRSSGGKVLGEDGKPARPIVIIDPRAGHGPGIGGSKMDSQIGIALEYGHPVYFVLFRTDPVPGQTISDVQRAEVRFLEKVAELHSQAPKPAVIGNCQAGWAAMLIAADRPELTGPLLLNGSPLSYWGGVEGGGPMRYRGGLYGGIWLTSLLSDLGDGLFDGAHLVAGFEDLHPGNTLWTKYYNLFRQVDTEGSRYLGFEKWWGGFFRLTGEEIHFIVDKLFVGNELEQGRLRLDDGRRLDLKAIRQPIFAFASAGDNITPPPQALNWIVKVYETVEEIKRWGQVIIYMVHQDVGHLGIFVSGRVARREHKEILANLGWLDYLKPGLYEMVIEGDSSTAADDDYQVSFAERDINDLLRLDDGFEDEKPFVPVRQVSKLNDAVYSLWFRPWLKAAVYPELAEILLQLHPLRLQRTMISDRNPLLWPLALAAPQIRANRRPVSGNNPFAIVEEICSENLRIGLDWYRDMRDHGQEILFNTLYNNPLWAFWSGFDTDRTEAEQSVKRDALAARRAELERLKRRLRHQAGRGGFIEAAIRVILAVSSVDGVLDMRELRQAEQLALEDDRLQRLSPAQFQKIAGEQADILNLAPIKAITGLAEMELSVADRKAVYLLGEKIAAADEVIDPKETKLLMTLREVLQIKEVEGYTTA